MRRALEEPMRGIVENAGVDGAEIVETVRRKQAAGAGLRLGYDVIRNEYVDTVERGIIDPAKVRPSAVENAASIAAMILTTEALITDIPEKERPAHAPPPEY